MKELRDLNESTYSIKDQRVGHEALSGKLAELQGYLAHENPPTPRTTTGPQA